MDLAPGAFLLVQVLGPMAVIALPSTPIFGGVKHFMPAMPYLAIVAAVGLRRLQAFATDLVADRGQRLRRAAPAALAALVCLPALVETRRSHPDGLSHYNLLAGGFAGGASLGMNRHFWGYPVLPILDQFAKLVPPSRATYWHDVMPDALNYYVRDGRLPPGWATSAPNRVTSPARTSACCSPSGTSRCSRPSTGRATVRPEPSWSARGKACPWSSSTVDGVYPNEPERHSQHRDRPGREVALGVRIDRLFASRWGLVIIYAFFLGAYLIASGPRLKRHSQYNHFVYLAEGWLDGRLSLKGQPPNENDWARVEVLTLNDGRVVRGKFGSTGATDRFYFTKGGSETIGPEEIRTAGQRPLRVVPAIPGGADVAVRGRLRACASTTSCSRCCGRRSTRC